MGERSQSLSIMQYLTPRASAGRYTLPPFRFSGLGYLNGPTDLQLGEQAAGVAAAGVGAGIASAAATTAAGAIIPFVGPAIAAASIIISAIMNSGCGQTCIVSTNFANQADAALQQNIEAYFKEPVPRSASAQAAALANFDKFWGWLVQQCSNSQLGNAGRRCITDRQAGSCVWKQPADKVPAWGTPAAGECWNWFNGYRDPIANDPNVISDADFAALHAPPQSAAGSTADSSSAPSRSSAAVSSNSSSSMILWGSAALVALAFFSGRDN